jgi:thymidylate synthase ThyX
MSDAAIDTDSIRVLDKGFVRLVDFMGGDLAVVQGARVSFGQETKGEDKDRKLINYLMKHEHGTPFEMALFKFHVKAPIFVARQWFRHRVGCLSGSTELHFDLPQIDEQSRRLQYKVPLELLHKYWQASLFQTRESRSLPPFISHMRLRMCNEETGAIEHTRINDIWDSGIKPVYRVTLQNGFSIKMTADHRCLTSDGWSTLKEATNLTVEDDLVVWDKSSPAFCVDESSCQLIGGELSRLSFLGSNEYATKSFSRIFNIEYVGEERTYDLEVAGPYHNFVANGFVVHNSYNEISYRYVEVTDEFYIPEKVRAQDTKNKQSSVAGSFTAEQNSEGQSLIESAYMEAYEKRLLEMGVARELARIVLPVGMYTQFYVAYNARSLMNFIRLRTGEGAQSEIRQYAEAMNQIFRDRMPWTHKAFEEHVLKRGE